MVHAHAAANHLPAAIELCETMCYNLRRSRGALDLVTIEMFQMLAALYTSDGRVERSMAIHEHTLREIEVVLSDVTDWQAKARAVIYYQASGNNNGRQVDAVAPPRAEDLAKTASWALELLKRSHLRLGAWNKPEAEYTALHSSLQSKLGKAGLQVPAPETWAKAAAANKDKPDDMIGKYAGLREWEWTLADQEHVNGAAAVVNGKGTNGGVSGRPKWGVDHVLVASQECLVA